MTIARKDYDRLLESDTHLWKEIDADSSIESKEAKKIFDSTKEHFLKNRPLTKKDYQSLIHDYHESIRLWHYFFTIYQPLGKLKKIAIIGLMRSYIGLMECYYVRAKDTKEEEIFKQAIATLKELKLEPYIDLLKFIKISHSQKLCDDIQDYSTWEKFITIIKKEIETPIYVDIIGLQYFNELWLDNFNIHKQSLQSLSCREKSEFKIKMSELSSHLSSFYSKFIDKYKEKLGPFPMKGKDSLQHDCNMLEKSLYDYIITGRTQHFYNLQHYEVYLQLININKQFQSDLKIKNDSQLQRLSDEVFNLEEKDIAYSQKSNFNSEEKEQPYSIELSISLYLLNLLINSTAWRLWQIPGSTGVKSLKALNTSFECSQTIKERYIDDSYLNIINLREGLLYNLLYLLKHNTLNLYFSRDIKRIRLVVEALFAGEETANVYKVIKHLLESEIKQYHTQKWWVKEEKTKEKHFRIQSLMASKDKKTDEFIIEKQIFQNLEVLRSVENHKMIPQEALLESKAFIEKNQLYLTKKYSKESYTKLLLQYTLALAKNTPTKKRDLAFLKKTDPFKELFVDFASTHLSMQSISLFLQTAFELGNFDEVNEHCDTYINFYPSFHPLRIEAEQMKKAIEPYLLSMQKIHELQTKLREATLQKDHVSRKAFMLNIIEEAKFVVEKQLIPTDSSIWWLTLKMKMLLFNFSFSEENWENYINLSTDVIKKLSNEKLIPEMLYMTVKRLIFSLEGGKNSQPLWELIIKDAKTLQKYLAKFPLKYSAMWEKLIPHTEDFKEINRDEITQIAILNSLIGLISPSSIQYITEILQILFTGPSAFFSWDKTNMRITRLIQTIEQKKKIFCSLLISPCDSADDKKSTAPPPSEAHLKISDFLQKMQDLSGEVTASKILELKKEAETLKHLLKSLLIPFPEKFNRTLKKLKEIEESFELKQQKAELAERKKISKEKQIDELEKRIIETSDDANKFLLEITELHKTTEELIKEQKEIPKKSLTALKEKHASIEMGLTELLTLAKKKNCKNISLIEKAIQTNKQAEKIFDETEKLFDHFYNVQAKKLQTKKEAEEKSILPNLLKYNKKEVETLTNELSILKQKIDGLLDTITKEDLPQLNIFKNFLHILRLNFNSLKHYNHTLFLKAKECKDSALMQKIEETSSMINKSQNEIRLLLNVIKKNNKLHGSLKTKINSTPIQPSMTTKHSSTFLQFYYQKLFPPSGKNKRTIYEIKKSIRFLTEEDFIIHFHMALMNKNIFLYFRGSAIAELFIYYFKPSLSMVNKNLTDNDMMIFVTQTSEGEALSIFREFGFALEMKKINSYFLHYTLIRKIADDKQIKYEITLVRNNDYQSINLSHLKRQLAYLDLPDDKKREVPYPNVRHSIPIKNDRHHYSIVFLDHLNEFKTGVDTNSVEFDLANPEHIHIKDVFLRAIKDGLFAELFKIYKKGINLTTMLKNKTWLRNYFLKKLYNNDPIIKLSAFKEIIHLISTGKENFLSTEHAKLILQSFIFILVNSYCQYAFNIYRRGEINVEVVTARMTDFLQYLFKDDLHLTEEMLSAKLYFVTKILLENIFLFINGSRQITRPPFSFINPIRFFPALFQAEMALKNHELSEGEVLAEMEQPYYLVFAAQFQQYQLILNSQIKPQALHLHNQSMFINRTPSSTNDTAVIPRKALTHAQ